MSFHRFEAGRLSACKRTRYFLGINSFLGPLWLLLVLPPGSFVRPLAHHSPGPKVQSTVLPQLKKSLDQKQNREQTLSQARTDIFHGNVNRGGIVFDLQIQRLQSQDGGKIPIRAGDNLRFRLALQDAETKSPLTGLRPSAWMNLRRGNENVPCKTMVQSFLSGSLLAKKPELDLNTYYVLALNAGASVTVVDPQFNSVRPRLIARIALKGRGQDWALTSDQTRLYVSQPDANEVAMVDTGSWRIVRSKQLPGPARTALQPDEHYLWVSYGSGNQRSGVIVLEATKMTEVAWFPTGMGPHDIAFSADSHFAFITNRDQGSVVTIDITRLARIQELKLSGHPASVAFSPIAQAAYVTNTEQGTITALSPGSQNFAPHTIIHAEPGITKVYFPRDGRLGFVLNPEKGLVHILDVARNQIVQTAGIDKAPMQISFSDQLAYVVRQQSDLIEMIPLDQVGRQDVAVPVVDLPGGPNSLSNGMFSDDWTATIAQTPGQNAVVIASRRDKAIYYYDEGMAAPMGVFSNFGEEPRAVMVIDRSFKESSPGVYETIATVNNAGTYILSIVLDSPQLVECFQIQ